MPETPINSCANCGCTFDHVRRPHHTYYEDTSGEDVGVSCFPLCEDCWSSLTPETRAPFYWDHILTARLDQPMALAIMQAVVEGK